MPREIEIWFVIHSDRFYLFSETGEAAAWVKNIRRNPGVMVRIEALCVSATARVLDREIDRELCEQVAAIAVRKYDWVTGCPWKSLSSRPRLRAVELLCTIRRKLCRVRKCIEC